MASIDEAQARAVDAATIQGLFDGGLVGFIEARSLLESVFTAFKSVRDNDLDAAAENDEESS